ncbi:MAG: TRAP transporter large permease subunit, partial [Dehalococcoidia bacterium]|nr:TRAP transporter large permease subunit [Dehalococcoidia bacterium]
IPIFVLVYTMFVLWLDASVCGVLSALAAIFASFLKKGIRLNLKKLLKALELTGETTLEIGIVCGAAGLIVGVVLFTGLGSSFAQILTEMSGGNLLTLLILAAIANIILGMGMPIITVYIIVVVLIAPALISMGVLPEAAHLFVIYLAMLSFLTPPVCLSVYAAMAIANSRMWPTALRAMKFSIAAYLVPFFFVYNPNLLLIGSPLPIVVHVTTAFVGLLLMSAGFEGYLFQNLGWVKRPLFIIAGLGLLMPFYTGEIIGGALGIFLILWEWLIKRRAALQLRREQMAITSSPLDNGDAEKGGES